MKNARKPEILAPAGSMEALRAAVAAGADAVYLGGSRFGARAYADNFAKDTLVQAIEYAHLYGVKVYLTINTLFRNEEIDALFDYLLPPFEAGLDAVIVQDLGVVKFVHQYFPELPIHASTQMTITTEYAYSLLKKYGVNRIVPARELSIEEIAALKKGELEEIAVLKKDEPEVEVFVQGALCYCYSGQCLMSSMLGGRSGNRGRCAQTCRLNYQLFDGELHGINTRGQYLLSPKDLCGLESIPDLIGAGVDSFKIEGRMKKPEYVAVCVDAYRKCVDAWFENRFSDNLVKKCKENMAAVFNRGGFTKGYYRQHNGKDMISIENPGNIGVTVGRITDISKNKISIVLDKDVSVGDILIISGKEDEITLTCNVTGKKNNIITLNVPRSKSLKKGQMVSRMQDAALVEKLQAMMEEPKIGISGQLNMQCGSPAEFILKTVIKGEKYTAKVFGNVVEAANANPLTEEVVAGKLGAVGGTRYQFEDLTLNMDQGIFYSLKGLKELRRNGLEALEKEILFRAGRIICEEEKRSKEEWDKKGNKDDVAKNAHMPAVMVSGMEQYQVVAGDKRFSDIYLDLQYFTKEGIMKMLQQKEEERHYFLVLPPVLRKENLSEVTGILEAISLGQISVAGIVVRNLDELGLIIGSGYKGKLITDYSLYTMNRWAIEWLLEQYQGIRITLPVELNRGQLSELTSENLDFEWIVYGYQQLMVSAQCVRNTAKGCNHKNEQFFLKDRYGKLFPVRCICKYCYNLIYNSVPTVLFEDRQRKSLNGVTRRIHFTVETEEEVKEVLEAFWRQTPIKGEVTRGHYRRGVE